MCDWCRIIDFVKLKNNTDEDRTVLLMYRLSMSQDDMFNMIDYEKMKEAAFHIKERSYK